jgi:hypothetical protein
VDTSAAPEPPGSSGKSISARANSKDVTHPICHSAAEEDLQRREKGIQGLNGLRDGGESSVKHSTQQVRA